MKLTRRSFAIFKTLQQKENASAVSPKFKPHTREHFSLPQSYFVEMKEKIQNAEDKEAIVEKVIAPEIYKMLEMKPSSRQIYKLLHPVAMLDGNNAAKTTLDSIMSSMLKDFRRDNYSSPMFLSN